jgi:HrpA-like RNA helicase
LTVEGVKIVIDSGLSKESRHDMKRRANVLEMSWISKSSANQRKGRAGRTSEGTCIRLFSEGSLTRESIEPEILRSSIDQILLQLKILKLEDLPLITRPDQNKWDLALENLKFVGALDSRSNVTSLGKLFSTLPFDPVISAFATDLYINHQTDIGIKTAALVTAPGELFYLGNKDTRNEDEKKIALKAENFDSDVIFKIDIYNQWNESGNLNSLENVNILEFF